MKFLIDSDVFSAITDGEPNEAEKRVKSWFSSLDMTEIGIPVLSVYERRMGIEKLIKKGNKDSAEKLSKKLQPILDAYDNQIVSIDVGSVMGWPVLTLKLGASNMMDAGILACASHLKLTVATGNYKHFSGNGVCLINPFKPGLDPHDGFSPWPISCAAK